MSSQPTRGPARTPAVITAKLIEVLKCGHFTASALHRRLGMDPNKGLLQKYLRSYHKHGHVYIASWYSFTAPRYSWATGPHCKDAPRPERRYPPTTARRTRHATHPQA